MQLPEHGVRVWARTGLRTAGDVVWFPRCPAAFVTPFTGLMLSWFFWLSEWGKTPIDWGASAAELDPRYPRAMEVLRREVSRIEREELDRIRAGAGR